MAIPAKLRPFYDDAVTINLPTGTGDQKQARDIRDRLLARQRAEFGRLIREMASAGPNISQAEIERIKAERQIEHQAKLRDEYWRDHDSHEAESFYLSNHPEKLGAEGLLRARGKPVTPENIKLVTSALLEAVDRAIAHDARGLSELKDILTTIAQHRGEPIEIIKEVIPEPKYIEVEFEEVPPEEWEEVRP